MSQRTPCIEIVDDAMVEILRAKTPWERLELANGLWRGARDLLRDYVRHQHPDWSEEAVHQEAARRMLNGMA